MKKTFFMGVSVLFFILSCEINDEVKGRGMVRFMDFEGGFYGIVADNGEHYLPENLASEFRKDSLHVAFEGIITNKITTQQWGRTIYLRHVMRIP